MTLPYGYNWKVIFDPTRTADYPGVFYGGHFRWTDIQVPWHCREDVPCPFPSGTVFENVKTGERIVIHHGKIISIQADVWLGLKPNHTSASASDH